MSDEDQAERRRTAALWYAQLQEPDTGPEDWAAFQAWERDPANAAAFRDIERALTAIDASLLATSQAPSAVVSPVRARSRWRLGLGAAAAVFAATGLWVLIGLGGEAPTPPQPALIYATAIGEQREVSLPDGSSALLNTASRIEIDYSDAVRRITLTGGQAFFKVAPASAPFIVAAGGSVTEATGTAFEVRLRQSGPEVTLLEGRVRVQVGDAAGRPRVDLAPGQRLTISNGEVLPVVSVDPGAALSWRSGIVQFTDTPLAEAAAEINRYSATQISIADAGLGAERISGAFRAGEPLQFASAVSVFLPVTVTHRGDTIEISPASD